MNLHEIHTNVDSISSFSEMTSYFLVMRRASANTNIHIDPKATDVVWHNNGRERCSNYVFNSKKKDQMFCPKCGSSLGIDFHDFFKDHVYGFSVSFIHSQVTAFYFFLFLTSLSSYIM